MNVSRKVVPILIFALMAGGCGKKTPPPPSPTVDHTAEAAEAEARARREAEEKARLEAEAKARSEAEARARTEAAAAAMRATLTEMVYFDYDQSAIREDSKPILDAKLRILRQDPAIRIRIEGHSDERGSNEYNVALGSRRAEAVRMYFTASGLQAQRFEIVSFGEEKPLERGATEASWSRNRRAQFQVLAGIPGTPK